MKLVGGDTQPGNVAAAVAQFCMHQQGIGFDIEHRDAPVNP